MSDRLERLATAVAKGNTSRESPYPPDLADQDGAAELCREALEAAVPPDRILQEGLVAGMRRVGDEFAAGRAFIPHLLMAAKAMKAAMEVLRPHLDPGEIESRGTIVLGTVAGDLHDIGKNVVRLVLEGEGWNVVDLGVDADTAAFVDAVRERPGSIVAMSALLTTTMAGMEATVRAVRGAAPGTRVRVYVGGAPVTPVFADSIGADGTFPDPYAFARHLAEEA